ncbi:MAG: lipoate--protein ligase family protein [Halobacteriota archaeon]
MRVVRGRGETPQRDRELTAEVLAHAAESKGEVLRVWTPHRQVAFGRRDAHEPGYQRARQAAEDRGFPPIERSVGGRAVAYTGRTVAFAHAIPVSDIRRGLDERYEIATTTLTDALSSLGVEARPGEPPNSFCPGAHSLQCRGKLAGVAQRIRRGAALVGGIVVVADHEEIAAVLDPVYGALGVPFDPDSVGSVARAGESDDADTVVQAVESAFVGGRDYDVRTVGVTGDDGSLGVDTDRGT